MARISGSTGVSPPDSPVAGTPSLLPRSSAGGDAASSSENAVSPESGTPDGHPLERRRLLTAFALTPLLAGFYPAIFLAEPALMPAGLVVAYLSTALFGVPLVYYFYRRGVREWWMYTIGGTACALPSILVYALAPLPSYLVPFGLVPALGLLLWGSSSGLIFWMIGVAGDSAVSLRTLFDPISSKK
jgi:hypothetical protein